jgi:hypothetical protein
MITGLFMGWTDPVTKCWYPIQKMSSSATGYRTYYINGVFQAIEASPNMRLLFERGLIKPDEVKVSQKIPSVYAQRMPIIRPEDAVKELEFLALPTHPIDPIAYVSRSGGYSITDGYDLFPEVTVDAHGEYHFYFLSQNLAKEFGVSTHEYIDRLLVGTVLECNRMGYLIHHNTILGKLPGYLADLVGQDRQILIEVAKINSQIGWRYYHLLCHATVKFKPFTEAKYQQILVNVLSA